MKKHKKPQFERVAVRIVKESFLVLPEQPRKVNWNLCDLVHLATRAKCPSHHDPYRFRGCTFRGTVFGSQKRSTGAKVVAGSEEISDKRGSGPG